MKALLLALLLTSCLGRPLPHEDANRNYHREPPPILQAAQTWDGSWGV